MRILDLGCGPNKISPDAIGIDWYPFDGVDIVRDLKRGLPFDDDSVVSCIIHHSLEHFAGADLIFLIEEMIRVTQEGGTILVTVPDATSPNRYKDPTHLERDWSAESFDMWKVRDDKYSDKDGEYIIERGPMYGIKGKLTVETERSANGDRTYMLTVV